MKTITTFILVFSIFVMTVPVFAQKGGMQSITQLSSPQNPRLGFVIHGGAGVIRKGTLSPEKEKEVRAKLEEAVMLGYKMLQEGKTSIEAVEAAINLLEDSPLFNAGKGAVFTNDGKNELDASIMDGKTLAAGAVAGVHHIKNPISLARLVMEKSPHVMMAGDGAEKFAESQGVKLVDEKYFFTQDRFDALQKVIEMEKKNPPKDEKKMPTVDNKPSTDNKIPTTLEEFNNPPKNGNNTDEKKPLSANKQPELYDYKYGTVGAVALDKNGDIAAGTSTGGMTNKRYGRVGDAPIIGAGTYADNRTCGVSATGWGEMFIRLGVARDISAVMEYRALPIQQAVDLVIQEKLPKLGGDGGVIAMDKFGNIGISFNSEGMYRAYINSDGKPVVEIYKQ